MCQAVLFSNRGLSSCHGGNVAMGQMKPPHPSMLVCCIGKVLLMTSEYLA